MLKRENAIFINSMGRRAFGNMDKEHDKSVVSAKRREVQGEGDG